jgi:hypothetical protein
MQINKTDYLLDNVNGGLELLAHLMKLLCFACEALNEKKIKIKLGIMVMTWGCLCFP